MVKQILIKTSGDITVSWYLPSAFTSVALATAITKLDINIYQGTTQLFTATVNSPADGGNTTIHVPTPLTYDGVTMSLAIIYSGATGAVYTTNMTDFIYQYMNCSSCPSIPSTSCPTCAECDEPEENSNYIWWLLIIFIMLLIILYLYFFYKRV